MATRVLLVDDEPDLRTVIGEGLKFFDMEVTTAESAEEAQKKLKFHQFDVILLDMMMPGMDGWTFARKLRLGPYKDIPIIAMTAAAGVGAEQKALSAGCTAYLPKPCMPKDVKRKIEQVLARQKKL
jgi:CheY-like chemotaxis protein